MEAEPFIGGSLFRIQRDVRFSRDKRPYKTHVGIRLRDRDTVHPSTCTGPLFYVESDHKRLRLGAGVKEFNAPLRRAYRRWLYSAEKAGALQGAIEQALESGSEIVSERLARSPAAGPAPHAELFRWKGIFVQKEHGLPKTVHGREFAEHCFRQLVPMAALFNTLREIALSETRASAIVFSASGGTGKAN